MSSPDPGDAGVRIERRALGSTGMRVPVLGMGTWRTFDVYGRDEQAARRALVTEAMQLGVTFYDSSPMYGDAERVLGFALTGRRERAIVATKVRAHDVLEGHAQIDRALHYFDGRVDLYQVHNLVNWQAYLSIFERMRADGSIRAFGITHYQSRAFREMAEIVHARHVDTIQVPYNPRERAVEQTLLPLAAARGVGVIASRPFGEGVLLRVTPRERELRRFRAVGCETWPQVLLKWVLSDPRVSVVIPATREIEHVRANAVAAQPPWLDGDQRAEVVRLAAKYVG